MGGVAGMTRPPVPRYLVEALADDLDADIVWVEGADADLMEALHGRSCIVIRRLRRRCSVGEAGVAGRSVHHDSLGRRRSHRDAWSRARWRDSRSPSSSAASRRRTSGHGERPRVVSEVDSADGPVIVDDWRLDELGLDASEMKITTTEHVVAVPLGESGWQSHVERFLLELPQTQFASCWLRSRRR